jgi:protochlorophyllide reductase
LCKPFELEFQACRNYSKAASAAKEQGMPEDSYTIMHLDLESLDSVRQFADSFLTSGRRLDCLVCNAAVYQPTVKKPSFTVDGDSSKSIISQHIPPRCAVNP